MTEQKPGDGSGDDAGGSAEAVAAKAAADKVVADKATADAKIEADKKKTPQDYIIERAKTREAKLEAELAEAKKESAILQPSGEALTVEQLFDQRAEREEAITDYITAYPELKDHRAKIKQYMADPTRKGLPIEEIIIGAIGATEFIRIGAERAKAASQESSQFRMGGGAHASTEGKTPQEVISEKYNNPKNLPKFVQDAMAAAKA